MIIDGSNLAYRAFHKFQNIRSLSEGNVGLVYGFIKVLQSYLIRFNPNELVITFDTKKSKKSNFRNDLLPDYKASRKTLDLKADYESFNRQLSILKKILLSMGITIIWDKEGLGHESDDYIAEIALTSTSKCLIISSDKDFCQLLNKRVKIFNPSKDTIIRYDTCEEIMEYNPKQHKDFLILVGDNSDNIKGYKGIGPVKARQFFNKFESIENFLSDKDNEFPWITWEGLEDLYQRNRVLIDLAYCLKKYPIKKWPIVQRKYNSEKLLKHLDKYSMNSFMKPDFMKPFKTLKPWTRK